MILSTQRRGIPCTNIEFNGCVYVKYKEHHERPNHSNNVTKHWKRKKNTFDFVYACVWYSSIRVRQKHEQSRSDFDGAAVASDRTKMWRKNKHVLLIFNTEKYYSAHERQIYLSVMYSLVTSVTIISVFGFKTNYQETKLWKYSLIIKFIECIPNRKKYLSHKLIRAFMNVWHFIYSFRVIVVVVG